MAPSQRRPEICTLPRRQARGIERRRRAALLMATVIMAAFAESIMEKVRHFSELSPRRQTLVRHCQDVRFGQILDLHVKDGEPTWDPEPTILAEVKLDVDETPRPERRLADFQLSSEILRLMSQLDHVEDGRIAKIEVREGIPRRIVLYRAGAYPQATKTPRST